jgi:hypothetical protein
MAVGTADMRSQPSETIPNNRTATIFVGKEIPIRVIDASARGGGSRGRGALPLNRPRQPPLNPRRHRAHESAGPEAHWAGRRRRG